MFPDQRRPGDAPCNLAFHAARLGDRDVIVTRVGDDADGDKLVAFLGERGVVTDYVQRDGTRPTGTVSLTIEDSDPRYAIAKDVAWDYVAAQDVARALASAADAICGPGRDEEGRHAGALCGGTRGDRPVISGSNLFARLAELT